MKIDKLIKKQIIKEASSNPEKYFPVESLKKLGMKRQTCKKCGMIFWSILDREVCGDSSCTGIYDFIGNTPATKKMEFAETYHLFRKFLEKRGYTHVDRFPIVARWRDDLDFNIASIIGFQPYITKGIVAPPAELVTIPQNCLRFGDIDNVGYTGRHGSNFVMIGQCAFKKPEEYDQAKYVIDLFEWFTLIMGIPKEEMQIHEDAWVGGGDCGPSMEFFSRGLELGNQVYMWFDMSEAKDIKDLKPLKIKVLDMGMGLERCCWFSKGSVNQYDATMPEVCKYLFEKTGFKPNWEIYNKFLPFSGTLNLDEVDDIDKAWEDLAKKIGKISVKELKEVIEPIAGIYSIADHTKTLLYSFTDGALPSNVKGGYNIRLVLRRALDFIYKFNWDINLYDVIVLQAEEIKDLYPEMITELEGIKKIIDLEVIKYKEHKIKIKNKIKNLLKNNKEISDNDYIKYYISDGITPTEIKEEFLLNGKELNIPANFFTQVTQYFEEKKITTKNDFNIKLGNLVSDLPETKMEFYNDLNKSQADFKILKEIKFENKKYIILDKTLFYPTMGGQACDLGFIGKNKVINVIKIGKIILHEIE